MAKDRSAHNLSSSRRTAREQRQRWRKREFSRTHQQLHDAADWIKDADVDATGLAKVWVSVGLRIAASMLEELAAEMLVEDIIGGEE